MDIFMGDYVNTKKVEVREILVKLAKNRKITYYSKIMTACHISRRKIGEVLIAVAEYCYDHDEPILSSLVEYKGGGIGEGYYYVVNQFRADPNYKKEQEKCFEYWENNNEK